MKNLEKCYTHDHLKEHLNELFAASPLCQNEQHTIIIPPKNGAGLIKDIQFEEGFSIRYFNFFAKDDIELDWFGSHDNEQLLYKLIYTLETPEKNALCYEKKEPFSFNQTHILLYLPDHIKNGSVEKNTYTHLVALLFTASWLEKNFSEAADKVNSLISDLKVKNKPTVISELSTSKSIILANEIANEMNKAFFPLIHIKTRSLILLNDFLSKIVKPQQQQIRSDQTIHYHTMTMVESRLRQCIQSELPRQHNLAAEFNLSTSTLKRHFRKVYGKNTYVYYQEKRMDLGRTILENEHKTINEVASILGYTKTNSFSKAFKKYFGFLPRELKYARGMMVS